MVKKNTTLQMVKFGLAGFFASISATTFASTDVQSALAEQAANQANTQNITWIMLAAILVFFMQAGFALLESGASRSKNAVNVMMKNFADVCLGSLIFYLVGFGLMMGENPSGLFGMSHFAPQNLSNYDWAILLFQMMFAATAVTIASGAMAERVHFGAYVLAATLICGFVYPVFASWVWGGHFGGEGWLASMGFVDFAGSTVVHSLGGWIAFAGIIIVGPRLGRFDSDGSARDIPGHNMSLVALGGFILWFCWFGFNAGSSLDASANLGKIALNTHLSAASAVLAMLCIAKLRGKSLLLTDAVNAALAGLVAITAGCATMSPLFAILTGFIAAFVYKYGQILLERLKVDDVVGAVPVHAFAGAWGTLAAGLFFESDLFNLSRVMVQLLGIGAACVWGFGMAYLVYFIINNIWGLRASQVHEQRGLDVTEHAEIGYPEFQKQMIFNKTEMESRR